MRLFALIVMMMSCSLVSGQIYQWTDSDGNVHFSDQPKSGAKKIELPTVQVFTRPGAQPNTPTPAPETPPTSDDKQESYSEVRITNPEDEATLRDSQGMVQVSVRSDPPLQGNDKYQMIFDGKKLGPAQKSPSFVLSNVYRGSHTLAVQIVDDSGKVLAESDQITIFMHPPRTNMVPRSARP